MMKILINDKYLDIYDAAISLHFAPIRFADAIADQYTTDFEVPLTANNLSLLRCFSMMERAQAIGKRIECLAYVGASAVPAASYIIVNAVGETSASLTLYVKSIPGAVLDAKVKDLVGADGPSTVFMVGPNFGAASEGTATGYYSRLYGGDAEASRRACRPSVTVDTLLAEIAAATGLTIAPTYSGLVVVPQTAKVCPSNARQTVWYHRDDLLTQFRGSQHIVNDVSTEIKDNGEITFNRDCDVLINFAAHATAANSLGFLVVHEDTTTGPSWTASVGDTTGSTAFSILAGDKMYIVGTGTYEELLFTIDYSNYTINEDDNGTDLVVPDDTVMYYNHSYILTNAWAYFGVRCNLPDVTVRQFLNSVCWALGMKAVCTPTSIGWALAENTKAIDAEITSVSAECDSLGKATHIAWAEGSAASDTVVDLSVCDALADEADLHRSIFYGMRQQYGLATALHTDEEGKPIDIKGAPLGLADTSLTSQTLSAATLSTMDFGGLSKVVAIDGSTFEDIRSCDFVVVEGHRFAVVEGDYDTDNGMTTFKAIEL